jgi:hypothetical protein
MPPIWDKNQSDAANLAAWQRAASYERFILGYTMHEVADALLLVGQALRGVSVPERAPQPQTRMEIQLVPYDQLDTRKAEKTDGVS